MAANLVCCAAFTIESVRRHVAGINDFLRPYKWITDAYVSDFFHSNFWSKLPSQWQSFLSGLSTQETAWLLDPQVHISSTVPPLSLLAYRRCAHSLPLARGCVDVNSESVQEQLCSVLGDDSSDAKSTGHIGGFLPCSTRERSGSQNGRPGQTVYADDVVKNGQYLALDPLFRRHVKPKKQHEILQLGKAVSTLCGQCGCGRVVDVGAGLGHLSRLLSFGLGLQVTTVEATGGHAPKAEKFDRDVQKEMKKAKQKKKADGNAQEAPLPVQEPEEPPLHVVATISTDISASDFLATIQRQLSDQSDLHQRSTEQREQHGNTMGTSVGCSKDDKDDGRIASEVRCGGCGDAGKMRNSADKIDVRQTGGCGDGGVEETCSCKVGEDCKDDDINGGNVSLQAKKMRSECPCCCQGEPGKQSPQQSNANDLVCASTQDDTSARLCGNFESNHNQNFRIKERDVDSSKTFTLGDQGKTRTCNNSETASDNRGIDLHAICSTAHLHETGTSTAERVPRAHSKTDKESQDTCRADTVADGGRLVMVGLHACGDLTATMLRVFVRSSSIVGLASVACCYMKLSTASCPGEGKAEVGFPMSDYLSALPEHQLSYTARELACHFADCYNQRLKESPPHLRVHGYRAALQHVIMGLNPSYDNGSMRLTVKNAVNMPFEQYAKLGLRRMGLDTETEEAARLIREAEHFLPHWRHVVAFYTLRLSLGPVLESLLLLDRMLYLQEHGISSVLVPIFNPDLSPRNFVLLARKSVSNQ